MTLLDTNVLSELVAPMPSTAVLNFINHLEAHETYTSVISIGELAFGIARLPEGRRRRALTEWLSSFEERYKGRINAPDEETAHLWGELKAQLESSGRTISTADGWIAATALRRGMRLATRNVRDFQLTGVEVIDPWIL